MKAANGYGSIVKLSGKRRRPYMIRITQGYDIDEKSGQKKQIFKIIGYAKTKKEAGSILQIYHENDSFKINYTFADVYIMWSKEGLANVSKSYISATHVAYNHLSLFMIRSLHYCELLIFKWQLIIAVKIIQH